MSCKIGSNTFSATSGSDAFVSCKIYLVNWVLFTLNMEGDKMRVYANTDKVIDLLISTSYSEPGSGYGLKIGGDYLGSSSFNGYCWFFWLVIVRLRLGTMLRTINVPGV